MERITNKWNDEIRNKAISIIRNLSTENSLSFEEKGVLSSFLVIERTENSKLAHYEDMEGQGLLTVIDNETFKRDNLDRCTHRHCNKCDKYRRDLQLYKDLEEQGKLKEQRYATLDGCFCSACKEDYTSVAEGEGGILWEGDTPNYCPWCGAKFVSEEELNKLEGVE